MAKETLIRERESKTDIDYRLLSKRKKERNFYDLWEEVKAELAKVTELNKKYEEAYTELVTRYNRLRSMLDNTIEYSLGMKQ